MGRRGRHVRVERAAPDLEAAVEVAARFLATRPRTRWEVERRLRRAGASDEVIGPALGRLTALGYVDDTAFARWWIEQRDRHAPRSQRLIEAELSVHRVPRGVITLLRESGSAGELDDVERVRAALAGHLRARSDASDPRRAGRAQAFLVRRGFGPDLVRAALREAELLD